MSTRFENIRRKGTSAVAALVVSAIFVGAAVGPAVSAPSAEIAQVQIVERAAA